MIWDKMLGRSRRFGHMHIIMAAHNIDTTSRIFIHFALCASGNSPAPSRSTPEEPSLAWAGRYLSRQLKSCHAGGTG